MRSDAKAPVSIAGYRIEGLLGTGGMSRVYRARQLSVDRLVALKVFSVDSVGGPQGALRLRREAKLLGRLDHPNIVRCIDYGDDRDVFFLALELVDGESLKQRLDRTGPLVDRDAVRIALAVARALTHAHEKGVVHRDVKPGNVLIAKDGRVKLTDFGLARAPEDLEITQAGTALGTPQYLSPEQARNPRGAGVESDVYSLGATLYHMLTGVPPHRGDTLAECLSSILFDRVPPPESRVESLDPSLSRIVAHAMARDRGKRYRSAREFAIDLERWLAGRIDTAVGISWNESDASERPLLARTAPWWIAATCAAVAIGIALHRRSNDPIEPPQNAPIVALDLVADVESGTLTPLEAFTYSGSDAGDLGVVRARLQPVIAERARAMSSRARALAREALAAGRIASGLERFESALSERCAASFGAPRSELPEEFTRILDGATAEDRSAVEDWQTKIFESADARLDDSVRELRAHVERAVGQRDFVAADQTLRENARAESSVVEAALRGALTVVIPESRPTTLDPEILAVRTRSLAEARESLLNSVAVERRRVVADGEEALRSAVVSEALEGRIEIAAALTDQVAPRLEIAPAQIASQLPELRTRIELRAEEIERERRTAAEQRRATLESAWSAALTEALSRFDLPLAERIVAEIPGLDPERVADPWLSVMLSALPEWRRMETEWIATLTAQAGKRIRIATRSIVKEGVFDSVSKSERKLLFSQPPIEVPFQEVAADEFLKGAETTVAGAPRIAVLLRYFAGDLDGARAALSGHEDAAWFAATNAVLSEALLARDDAARGEASRAERELAEFDAARADGRGDDATRIAEELLRTPALSRQPGVRARRSELAKYVESGRTAREENERKQAFLRSTHARVEFTADATVTLLYDFTVESMLDDITLPGNEWTLRDGKLSALAILDRRDGASRIDLFRNRPGLRITPPLDANRQWHVAVEIALPLEPAPGLVGLRLGSVCFVIRNFPDPAEPGQVVGYIGTLDEFRDYLFEPALGETRPHKSGGGSVRPFELERGNRYLITIDLGTGADAEAVLSVEGETIYRFKIGAAKRSRECELRFEMPCEIDEWKLTGTPLGGRR